MTVDSANLPDDRFGYSVYAVVIMAPREIMQMVGGLRQTLRITRPMIPAHVTVKGTFYDIPDLDELRKSLSGLAGRTRSFRLRFDGQQHANEGKHRFFAVQKTYELESLHRDLESIINPISRNAYGDHEFQPHLTLYERVSEQQAVTGQALAEFMDPGAGFIATAFSLMGRRGKSADGTWVEVQRYALGSSGGGD